MKSDSRLIYVVGIVLGIGVGLISAHLYKRGLEENGGDAEDVSLRFQDIVKFGMLLFGLVRQFAEAGSEAGKSD